MNCDEQDNNLKRPCTYKEQIEIMKEHNLYIPSDEEAQSILERVNYYRLSAYGIGLKDKESNKYFDGTSISTLYRLYCFDSKFRNIIFHTIEQIEIQIRSQISYHMATHYGAECYMYFENFDSKDENTRRRDEKNKSLRDFNCNFFVDITRGFSKERNRNKDMEFVEHHNKKYDGHFPIWVATELFTFGNLQKLYFIMKEEDRKEIAKIYNTNSSKLDSWLDSLVEIRNNCAHYNRIYNRNFNKLPILFSEDKKRFSEKNSDIRYLRKIFTRFMIMKKMLERVDSPQWQDTFSEIKALFEEYKDVIKLENIGFPENWEKLFEEEEYKPNAKKSSKSDNKKSSEELVHC